MELEIPSDVELCMRIVRELRAYGCVQGRDFDFAYIPVANWSLTDTESNRFNRSYVGFTFTSEFGCECATLIQLKYG